MLKFTENTKGDVEYSELKNYMNVGTRDIENLAKNNFGISVKDFHEYCKNNNVVFVVYKDDNAGIDTINYQAYLSNRDEFSKIVN